MKVCRFIFGVLALAVMIGTTGAFSSTQAHASWCSSPDTIEEAFIRADIVFKGVVEKVATKESEVKGGVMYASHRFFRVSKIYKAPPNFIGNELAVTDGGDRVFKEDDVGREFIVYATHLTKEHGYGDFWSGSMACRRSYETLEQRLHDLEKAKQEKRLYDTGDLFFTGTLQKALHRLETTEKSSRKNSELFFVIDELIEENLSGNFPWRKQAEGFTGSLRNGTVIKINASDCDREFRLGETYLIQIGKAAHLPVRVEEDGAVSGFHLRCHPSFRHSININEEKLLQRLSKIAE